MPGTVKLDVRSLRQSLGWRSDAEFKRGNQERRPTGIYGTVVTLPDAEDADEFAAARFAEGPEHTRFTYGISARHQMTMESIRMPNDGRVTILADPGSKSRGTAVAFSVRRKLEMLLLRRDGRRGR